MAQSKLELAVGTGKWDSGLKKAQSSLNNFIQAHGGLNAALDKENQKIQQFVGMMGKMESTAKTAKGQMNDYKGSIEQLSAAYNRMTDAQKQSIGPAYLQAIDSMKQKFKEAKAQVDALNQSMNDVKAPEISTGGFLGGLGGKLDGMLQVFGGNLMTKAASAAASFAAEMGDMVRQGVEMAKAGEGIRIAFDRLNQPGLLDNLREATHGTVTNLELMKAAVKFNDFKLPLDQLGTMLAFAQQKAKDTGQSVDYMVDSIVTGLGRKSLMILDNLGISASDVRERMKETGDMTKAVGDIIREQMAKAGDYVETAADRATRADVDLKNAMEDLGRTFQPLSDAGASAFNSLKVSALNLLNSAIKPLIQAMSEAGFLGQGAQAGAGYNKLGGDAKMDRMIGRLGNGKSAGAYSIYQQQLGKFDEYINNKRFQIAAYGNDNSGIAQSAKAKLQAELEGALRMRAEYVKRAQELHNQVPSPLDPSPAGSGSGGGGGRTGGGGGSTFDISKIAFDQNKAMLAGVKAIEPEGPSEAFKAYFESIKQEAEGAENSIKSLEDAFKALNGKEGVTPIKEANKAAKESQKQFQAAASAIQQAGSAMQSIEDPSAKVMGIVAQAIGSIALGFAQASAQEGKGGIWYWIAATAAGLATMVSTISAIHSATGYAQGGIVKGNSYSGDNIGGLVDGSQFVGLNAGEVVLTQAMAGNLASQIQGGGLNGLQLTATVHAEQLRFLLNTNGKRTGKGEVVTTNFR